MERNVRDAFAIIAYFDRLLIIAIFLDKLEKKSNWWIHCLTSNYLSKWYRYTIQDINLFQSKIEEDLLESSHQAEQNAVNALQAKNENGNSPVESAIQFLTEFHDSAAAQVRDKWWDFFFQMAGKYRDVYIVTDPHAKDFTAAYKYLSISK